MEEGRPSKTALMMAGLRAHHLLSAEAPRVLSDTLAMPLAGLESPDEVRAFADRMADMYAAYGDRAVAEGLVRDMTMSGCGRSAFFEDRLAASLARGMRQLVILGAGLDSTAYRRADIIEHLDVFEVDYPATQTWKRERLASIGVPTPENVTFVPFDFDRQTLAEALAAGGVRADRMTFFSWLGVQPYLSDDAVMATLDTIAAFPSGSELVLDLFTTLRFGQSEVQAVAEGGLQLVASIGEGFKSTYAPEDFAARLRERGFARIDMVSFDDWFRPFDGRFVCNAPIILVSAQVG